MRRIAIRLAVIRSAVASSDVTHVIPIAIRSAAIRWAAVLSPGIVAGPTVRFVFIVIAGSAESST